MLSSAAAVGLISFFANPVSAQDWSVGQPRENCDIPDYAMIQGAGGGDGNAFCGSKFKEGILVKKIEVQGHYEIIRGITVTYTDNTYDTFGRMDFEDADETRRNTLEFDPTVDSVTKAEIWPNGWNAHGNEGVASLVFETSNGGKIGKTAHRQISNCETDSFQTSRTTGTTRFSQQSLMLAMPACCLVLLVARASLLIVLISSSPRRRSSRVALRI